MLQFRKPVEKREMEFKLKMMKREGVRMFLNANVIGEFKESGGAKVAKQKMFVLLEPLDPSLKGVKDVLGRRNVNPIKLEAVRRPLNSVDVLHLLEYYAKQGRGEFDAAYRALYDRCPGLVREAVEMARVISRFTNDPEGELARLCVEYVEGR